ncbi:MAG: hypothetical protein DMG13_15475 [Acidobacteria bacterium]|nr:MAG: hypothetical protein DMG13_15475 [Acidobacteriota bacterium]
MEANPSLERNARATCTECGGAYHVDDMIRYGNSRVCVRCKPGFLQKLAEGAEIRTGEMRYAGLGTRFGAVCLDGILLWVALLGLQLMAGLSMAQSLGVEQQDLVVQLVFLAIQLVAGISYETILIGKYGATVGKMLCKIKVVTADGGRVSYLRAVGRYFAKVLSAVTLMIGYIIAAFDHPENRALHDRLCNTRVVTK